MSNQQSTVSFVPAIKQEVFPSTEMRHHGNIKNTSQTFYNDAAESSMIDKTKIEMKRGSVPPNQFTSGTIGIDALATVRTQDINEANAGIKSAYLPQINLRDSHDSDQLSEHEKKEAEVYEFIANNPNRNIVLLEQQPESVKQMAAEYRFKKTYERISLPFVTKK